VPLTTDAVLDLLEHLEQLTAALWRCYGAAIADRRAALGIETPRPRGARWAGRRGPALPDDAW
jgi:hypothetical protein